MSKKGKDKVFRSAEEGRRVQRRLRRVLKKRRKETRRTSSTLFWGIEEEEGELPGREPESKFARCRGGEEKRHLDRSNPTR